MRAGWMTVMGRFFSLPITNLTAYSPAPLLQPYSSRLMSSSFVWCVFSQKCPTVDHACLSFPIIPLVSHSFSPDRSLGLALWHCLSHQMLIGHSGRVWEPENELLTDYSLLCTLHQRKETEEGEGRRARKAELQDISLMCLAFKISRHSCFTE